MPTLPAELTLDAARATLTALAAAIDALPPGAAVEIDAAGLQRIDSSALAVLFECRRHAEKRGSAFTVRQPPPRLVELARLYGVQDELGIH